MAPTGQNTTIMAASASGTWARELYCSIAGLGRDSARWVQAIIISLRNLIQEGLRAGIAASSWGGAVGGIINAVGSAQWLHDCATATG